MPLQTALAAAWRSRSGARCGQQRGLRGPVGGLGDREEHREDQQQRERRVDRERGREQQHHAGDRRDEQDVAAREAVGGHAHQGRGEAGRDHPHERGEPDRGGAADGVGVHGQASP